MDDRLDPQERYDHARGGIEALLDLKADDAHGVMDPRFWTKDGPGTRALEGLREVARYYADEHGAANLRGYCNDLIDDPKEAGEEAHAECAQAHTQAHTQAGAREEQRG